MNFKSFGGKKIILKTHYVGKERNSYIGVKNYENQNNSNNSYSNNNGYNNNNSYSDNNFYSNSYNNIILIIIITII